MVGGIAASKHQVHALLNSRQQKHGRTDRQRGHDTKLWVYIEVLIAAMCHMVSTFLYFI